MVVKFKCPKCKHKWEANLKVETDHCPKCKTGGKVIGMRIL